MVIHTNMSNKRLTIEIFFSKNPAFHLCLNLLHGQEEIGDYNAHRNGKPLWWHQSIMRYLYLYDYTPRIRFPGTHLYKWVKGGTVTVKPSVLPKNTTQCSG